MPEIEEIEIRSDEVQEILSHTPNWLIRWGITSIFFLILILIGISYLIKYPDVIQGNITLTTEIPPAKLVSKTNGKLTKIYAKNGALVKKNDFITDIESPLTDSAVNFLKQLVSSIQLTIEENKNRNIKFEENTLVFGEMQTEYGQLKKTYHEYYQFISNPYRKNKINGLRKQLSHYRKLSTINNRQLNLTEQDLKNGEEQFISEKNLYEKGMISKMDFFEKQTALNQKKQQVENLKKTYVQHQITLTDFTKQLNDLEYETEEKERMLKESIQISCNTIQNQLNSWQQQYRITAPFEGKLSYLSNLNENQYIKAGSQLVAIIPNNNQYEGSVRIPAQGFGKVELGQQVRIKLNNYPSNEFGQLEGIIKEINLIPISSEDNKQSYYLAKIELTNGLMTTYKKELAFKPEMSGTAEIITKDLRLIDRIFNQFRKLMDN